MSKRYILAFLFSILVLLLYPYYLKLVGVSERPVATSERPPSPKKEAVLQELKLRPAPSAQSFPYRNELFEVFFTSQGGSLSFLKQGKVVFYEAGAGEKGIFGIRLLHEAEDLTQEIFQAGPPRGQGSSPRFEYEKPGQYRITKSFFVGGQQTTLILESEIENISGKERRFTLEIEYALKLADSSHAEEQDKQKAVISLAGEIHVEKQRALQKKSWETPGELEWHGLLKKHYALLVKPDQKTVSQETRLEANRFFTRLRLAPMDLKPGEKKKLNVLIYAGPQHYESLKEFGVGFEKIFSKGVLGLPRLLLLSGLNFFKRLTGNYGIAILLITLLIKILFTPFTHFSYQSMAKMQALQPKVKALQKHHQKDPARMNKELMELYRRNRVNPLGGCLPMVLQIPVFIAFYQVLSEAVELRGAPFIFWIQDLSQPDRLFTLPASLPFVGDAFNLLPLLMIGSMVWQQALTPQTAATPAQEKLMYLMPIIFGFVFYNLPSGLVLYWLVNNLLTIFHQLVIKRIPVILHHEDQG